MVYFSLREHFHERLTLNYHSYLARVCLRELEVNKHIGILSNFYLLFILTRRRKTIITAKKTALFYCSLLSFERETNVSF